MKEKEFKRNHTQSVSQREKKCTRTLGVKRKERRRKNNGKKVKMPTADVL